MCKPKKFDLVHQTVSPRERVGSGDETKARVCLYNWKADFVSSERSVLISITRDNTSELTEL